MKQRLLHKVFFNINWILLEKVSKVFLAGITSLIIARYLGPSGLGLLSLALSIYSIFFVISSLGLERIILRELGEPENSPESVIGSALILRSFGSLIAFISLNVGVAQFYQENDKLQLMTFLLSLTFFISIGNTFESYYRKQLRSKNVTAVRVLALFLSATLKLSIVGMQLDVIWFVLPAIIDVIFTTLGFAYLRLNDVKMTLGRLNYSFKDAGKMLSFAWPLTLSGIAGTLYFHMDRLVILEFMSESDVGRYALLAQLVSMLGVAFSAINLSLTPFLNKVYFENAQLYWTTLREVTAYKVLLAVGIGLCLPFVVDYAVPILAGEGFVYSQAVLWCFSAYIVCNALSSLNIEYWVLQRVVKPIFYIRILTLVINLLLNILLIPKIGIVGAAIATLVSMMLQAFIFPLFFPRMRKVVISNLSSLGYLFNYSLYKGLYSKVKALLRRSTV